MFCGHRADTQGVDAYMRPQGPRLRWPSNLASLWIPVMGPDLFPASHPSGCLPRSLGAEV